MDNWITTFRSARSVEGEKVIIPGDPERETASERLTSGIPMLMPVVDDLIELGKRFGLTNSF
jgi:LDH2 family malate/lactate/ureidoglycolate dehydrogenase